MKKELNLYRLIFIVCCFTFTTVLCIYQCDGLKAQEVEATVEINGEPLEMKINQSTDTIYVLSSSGVSAINGITSKVVEFFDLNDDLICNNAKLLIDSEDEQNDVDREQKSTFEINSQLDRIFVLRETSVGVTFAPGELDEPAGASVCTDVVIIDSKSKNIIKTLNLHEASSDSDCPACFESPQIGRTLEIISSPTNNIYIASETFNTLSIIDGATNEIIGEMTFDSMDDLKLNSVTNRLYILHNGLLEVLDTDSNILLDTIEVGSSTQLAIDENNNTIYVIRSNDLIVIDGSNNKIANTIQIGSEVKEILDISNSKTVYAFMSNSIKVIDAANHAVIDEIDLDKEIGSAVHNTRRNRIYVTVPDDNIVKVIDGDTNEIVANGITGNCSSALTANNRTDRIYTGNQCDETITVFNDTLVPFTPDFTVNLRFGIPPLTVDFFDRSFGLIKEKEIEWDFGDGEKSSELNPTHVYSEIGSYTVSLKTVLLDENECDNGNCESTLTKENLISVTEKLPEANLQVTFNPEAIANCGSPFEYRVSIEETNGIGVTITSYRIEEILFTLEDFETNFIDCGRHERGVIKGFDTACFDVSETDLGFRAASWKFFATDDNGNDLKAIGSIKLNLIPISDNAPPLAEFTSTPTEGVAPLKVQFVDLSLPSVFPEISDWFWSFGDGGTSTESNPSHTYTKPGDYNVSLNVSVDFEETDCKFCFDDCASTETKTAFITVENPIRVDPDIVRKSVRPQSVKVSIIDQSGRPVPGKKIDAKTIGELVTVNPETATTNENGKAEFKVRFKALSKGGEVEFTSTDENGNSVSTSVSQK